MIFGPSRIKSVILRTPPSSKNLSPSKNLLLRRIPFFEEQPFFEEPPSSSFFGAENGITSIFDLRTRRRKNSPSSIFHLRSRRSKNPPSSFFGDEDRRTPHLRSSEAKIEELPIFDLRSRRSKNSLSSIFDLRARRSKNPPSSIFGAEDRKTPYLQSSIFGAEDRRTPHLRSSAPKNGSKIGRKKGGWDFFFRREELPHLPPSRSEEWTTYQPPGTSSFAPLGPLLAPSPRRAPRPEPPVVCPGFGLDKSVYGDTSYEKQIHGHLGVYKLVSS